MNDPLDSILIDQLRGVAQAIDDGQVLGAGTITSDLLRQAADRLERLSEFKTTVSAGALLGVSVPEDLPWPADYPIPEPGRSGCDAPLPHVDEMDLPAWAVGAGDLLHDGFGWRKITTQSIGVAKENGATMTFYLEGMHDTPVNIACSAVLRIRRPR